MRVFISCKEAVKEVERDLWEMGHTVQTQTMQDKDISGDPDYITKEVSPYAFSITEQSEPEAFIKYLNPDEAEFKKLWSWCEAEFQERIAPQLVNPGTAYLLRPDIWSEYLHNGRFAYSYNCRMRKQLTRIIEELDEKPGTRQAILSIHDNNIDIHHLGGGGRVPCSMHYQFIEREGVLDMIYVMRSSDLLTHFCNDNYLAIRLMHYVAQEIGAQPGTYTFFTGSLHAYHKDMKARSIF